MLNAHEVDSKLSYERKRIKLYRQNCNRVRYFISTDPDTIYTSVTEAFEAWDKIYDFRELHESKDSVKYGKKRKKKKAP